MSPEPMELLSAFLDGETVDPKELASALAEPGARDAMRDFLLLRAEIQSDASRPSPGFYKSMSRALGPSPEPRRWWRVAVPIPAPALAAAVLLVLVMGLGLLSARRGVPSPREPLRPPVPQRVIHFVPGVDWQSKGSERTSITIEEIGHEV